MGFTKNFSLLVVLFLSIFSLNTIEAVGTLDLMQITSLPNGIQVAVWQDNTNGLYTIYSSTYTSSWSTPAAISVSGDSSFNPKISTNTLGSIACGWQVADPVTGVYELYAATNLDGASWSTPALLSNPNNQATHAFFVSTDPNTNSGSTPNGNAQIIWTEIDPTNSTYSLWTSTTTFNGTWSAAVQIE